MTAQREEVVVRTDVGDLEDVLDQRADLLLARRAGRAVGGGRLGLRVAGPGGDRRGRAPALGSPQTDRVQPGFGRCGGQGGEEVHERLAVPGESARGVEVGVGVEVDEETVTVRAVVDHEGEVLLGADREAAYRRGTPGEREPRSVHDEVDLGAPQALAVADHAEVTVDVLVAVALVPQHLVQFVAHRPHEVRDGGVGLGVSRRGRALETMPGVRPAAVPDRAATASPRTTSGAPVTRWR